jgi:hypothetical protein
MADAQSRRTFIHVKKPGHKNAFGKLPTSDRPLTIRMAAPKDNGVLRRLAQLDSGAPLEARVLLAELDDEVIAAASLDGGRMIADPFAPSAYAVRMLTMRRYQLMRQSRERFPKRFLPRRAPDPPLVVRRGET